MHFLNNNACCVFPAPTTPTTPDKRFLACGTSNTRAGCVSLSAPSHKMALVPFSYASPFTDQLQLAERIFTIDGRLLRIRQVRTTLQPFAACSRKRCCLPAAVARENHHIH